MTYRRTIILIVYTAIFSCLYSTSLWAAISISPAIVRVKLDKKRPAGQFTIRNVGDEEERFRIKAQHFTYSENGSLAIIPADENSLAPWIKFNPKEFTLPPKSRRSVRFVIVPRGNIVPKREYWGSIELQSLKENTQKSYDAGGGKSMSVKLMTSILVPIFATKGEIAYSAQLENVQIVPEPEKSTTRIEAMVVNPGKGALLTTMRYEIVDGSGTVVKEDVFGKSYVLPESKRLFRRSINSEDLQKGPYTVKVECSESHLKEPLQQSFQYTW